MKKVCSKNQIHAKKFDRQKLLLVIVIICIGTIASLINKSFLKISNITNIFQSIAVLGIITMAQTMLIIMGCNDLSYGGVIGLVSCTVCKLATETDMNIWLVILISLVVGTICGIINGIIVSYSGCVPLIVTLGLQYVYYGITLIIVRGNIMVADNKLSMFTDVKLFGLPLLLYVFAILWWGGMGNSTEHTAYLNLKRGIDAPQSGSMARNGPVLSQQIGAQIFMDAYAMMCPGDPEQANRLVRACASVSHDGVALDAAGFLGALEAAAFDEKKLDRLFDSCARYIRTDQLRALVNDVRTICAAEHDWRKVRTVLDSRYGYHLYPGPCHMIPNHAMVLAAILCAGDSFAESVKIGASAAWDTDCNAGNVGCFNGIRLGLDAISEGPDFRGPVADRLLVITSDGGEGLTDAVRETRKIVRAAAKTRGTDDAGPAARFAFEYPGSVQGFMPCPYVEHPKCPVQVTNGSETGAGPGLLIRVQTLAEGANAFVSTATFLDIKEEYRNYETYHSPTLYSGQTVTVCVRSLSGPGASIRPYVWYADRDNRLQKTEGAWTALTDDEASIAWTIPDNGGLPVLRFGLELQAGKRFAGDILVTSVDWSNTPLRIEQKGVMMRDMWDLNPFWAKMFVASARNFAPNLNCTYCISHDEPGGLATLGTHDFTDYTVSSRLKFSLHDCGGLVARACGHRRYYAAACSGGDTFQIICRFDDEQRVLAEAKVQYEQFVSYPIRLCVKGNELHAQFGSCVLTARDEKAQLPNGGAGFFVDSGAVFIDGFLLTREE